MGIQTRALAVVCLVNLVASSPTSLTTNKICPILGPSFPKPSNIEAYPAFQNASKTLDGAINAALLSGISTYGVAPFNTSTFSIGVYSANDDGLAYQKHYTDPTVANSSVGVTSVDADTVYRIGSTSKLFTVLGLLSKVGYQKWYDPITLYLPKELFAPSKQGNLSTGALPRWNDITIGDLASQLSGLSREYGQSDRAFSFPTLLGPPLKGFPPLPASEIPTCGYFLTNDTIQECTIEEIISGLSTEPAAWAVGRTPSYSNSAYVLLGLIAHNITGMSMSQIFQEAIIDPLNLQHTFYDAPVDPSLGAIPLNTTAAGWSSRFGFVSAAGGNFASLNDCAAIGKGIMSNVLLSKPTTDRWLRPVSFQAGFTAAVGAPWEITRWQTPQRVYDIYAKDGALSLYASLFTLVPDLGIGVCILEIDATQSVETSPIKDALVDVALANFVPVVEDIARQQADTRFSGSYKGDGNSSVIFTTDDQPGLRMTQWISNGTDILAELASGKPQDVRLWPNDLYDSDGDCKIGFTATFAPQPRPGVESPVSECFTWGGVDSPTYGNVALGHVVFGLEASSVVASSVRMEASRMTLVKVK